MLEWTAVLLVVAILVARLLEVFEVVDLSEVVVGLLKLIAHALFAVGAFFLWLMTRQRRQKQ
jgi:hypothetical protein